MKIKHSKNMLYSVKAKVFATKLGKNFGRIVHTTVVANDSEDAIKQGEQNFKSLCTLLKNNHNNEFSYTDLTIE